MSDVRFGTDGIRGPAGVHPITPDVARRVGRAAARLAAGEPVVVGHDSRPSGEQLAAAVVAGVLEAGSEAVTAGLVPTAAVAMALHRGRGQAGVMVTASHNPAADNGFKVFGPGGHKLDGVSSARVEAWLGEPAPVAAGAASVQTAAPEIGPGWLTGLQAALPDLQPLRGRRIGIDLAAGGARIAADWLRRAVPAEVVLMGTEGVVNAGIGSENIDALGDLVRSEGLDGGFAVDGDADRCRVVDEQGRAVPGDAVAWRLARSLGVTGLAVTVMSNGAIEAGLPGVLVVRTPVGDRHLRQAMDLHGLQLGAEESGHVLFANYPTGDGLLTGLETLAACWADAGTLSTAFAGFAPLPRQVDKVRVRDRPELATLQGVQDVRRAALEGLGPHGRIFLRYSGTEPVLRVLVEGADADAVAAAARAVCRSAAEALG